MASWLCSSSGFSAIPSLFIITFLSKHYGRKTIFIIGNFNLLISLFIFYFSTTPTQILISHITSGFGYAACFSNNILIVAEYIHPKYRGVFLAVKSTSVVSGVWAANAIGTFLNWRVIPIFGLVLSFFAFTSFFWPESPYWLANKGKFDECKKSYIWLNGSNDEVFKEIDFLIQFEKQSLNFKFDLNIIVKEEFYKPILISFLLMIQYHFSGKFIFSIYALDIIKKITDSESTAYIGMLILDGITVFGMYFGCFLAKILKRRTLYLWASVIGIFFLFSISLYLFLCEKSLVRENKFVSILLLASFSVSISCGPMILSTSIYGEILPSRFKSLGVILTALLFYLLLSTMLKIAPVIFKYIGLDGAFLFYGITSGLCCLLLVKYLPETKDKTLQEIEELFKRKERVIELEKLQI
ncbi:PREDICTED: facilitated trehalose transporter Tret1-like isoform X2 [Papilio polytes]|nr:PREDICTED: facilitated trehalose transporter Tret1-like isoform X2 [Papilio polytes]